MIKGLEEGLENSATFYIHGRIHFKSILNRELFSIESDPQESKSNRKIPKDPHSY